MYIDKLYILELKEKLLKYKSYILNKLVIYVIYIHTHTHTHAHTHTHTNNFSGCHQLISILSFCPILVLLVLIVLV